MMLEWWESLDIFYKIIWTMAIVSSLIFVIQMILTFAGMDGHADVDADFSGDLDADGGPFQLFTFRNFIHFFLGFSWGCIALEQRIQNTTLLVVVAFLIGAVLVALTILVFYQFNKLNQSGNMNIQNALSKTGEVYLTIPPHKSGTGKVHISIQGSLREIDAMTEGEKIPTGKIIQVKNIINDKILLVEEV